MFCTPNRICKLFMKKKNSVGIINLYVLIFSFAPFIASIGYSLYTSPSKSYLSTAINLSGSQRMRTMLLSNYSLQLYNLYINNRDLASKEEIQNILTTELVNYSNITETLTNGGTVTCINSLGTNYNEEFSLETDNFPEARIILNDITLNIKKYVDNCSYFLENPLNRDILENINSNAMKLKNQFDDLTNSFQKYNDRIILTQKRIDSAVLLFAFCVTIYGLKITKKIFLQEEALRKANSYQKKLIQQQEILKDDLVEANKLSSLGMMVAGVAHELNTPVGAAMLSANQLFHDLKNLQEGFDKGLTRQEFLNFLETGTEGVKLLIHNQERAVDLITRFKRLAYERSEEKIHSFPVQELLDDVVKAISPQLKKKSIHLDYKISEGLILETRYGPLSQIFQNLIINAIDHAFPDEYYPKKNIFISIKDQLDGNVAIEVTDSGTGINPMVREKIFDPFVTTGRNKGNTGLGLHLVHQWTTSILKGKISANTTLGAGTTFRIEIPKMLSHTIMKN